MKILLTNDDGIDSQRLKFTRDVLLEYGEVYIVAPRVEQSAKSMSLTIGGVKYNKINNYEYSVDGTPVDCINFAIQGLKLNPDLIVSGTNMGYNIGIDTRYSGTVGAALQGQYFGYKTLALSAERGPGTILHNELKDIIKFVLDKNLLSENHTINVNFARDKYGFSKGILLGRTYYRQHLYKPTMVDGVFKPNRVFNSKTEYPEDTDVYAYYNGYTSVCKIKL